jgi:hypothetical protein
MHNSRGFPLGKTSDKSPIFSTENPVLITDWRFTGAWAERRNGDIGVDCRGSHAKACVQRATGALLELKPSRFIYLVTVFVRHAVLNYSSTRLRRAYFSAPGAVVAFRPRFKDVINE